jgi:hypothetical protein
MRTITLTITRTITLTITRTITLMITRMQLVARTITLRHGSAGRTGWGP